MPTLRCLPAGIARGRPRWRLLALAACLAAPLAAQPSREYDLKAVFLYNFATFVEWPREATPAPGAPFVIGILGQDPFGSTLQEVVAGEKIRGSPLQMRHCQTVEEARACQILFISASEAPRFRALLAELRGHPVLTVADAPQFLEAGGIIAFSTGARVQLQVNAAAARAAGLTISSKLLRVARVVGDATAP